MEKNYLVNQGNDFWRGGNDSGFLELDFLFAEQNFNYVFFSQQSAFFHPDF